MPWFIPSQVTNPDGFIEVGMPYATYEEAVQAYEKLTAKSLENGMRYGGPVEAPDPDTAAQKAVTHTCLTSPARPR